MCHCSDDRSQSTEVASENCEQVDKSLFGSTTQRLFAAYNLAELTAANQSEQKYATAPLFMNAIKSSQIWL